MARRHPQLHHNMASDPRDCPHPQDKTTGNFAVEQQNAIAAKI